MLHISTLQLLSLNEEYFQSAAKAHQNGGSVAFTHCQSLYTSRQSHDKIVPDYPIDYHVGLIPKILKLTLS
jgi:hypothetical protein